MNINNEQKDNNPKILPSNSKVLRGKLNELNIRQGQDKNAHAFSFSSYLEPLEEPEEELENLDTVAQEEVFEIDLAINETINDIPEDSNKNEKINKSDYIIMAKNIKFSSVKDSINLEKLEKADIEFFKQCFIDGKDVQVDISKLQAQQATVVIPQTGQQVSYKSFNVSKGLSSLIEYAAKSQKPVRLDIGKQSSVVLKVNKEGQLSASFISNDQAMEQAIKSNLHYLRQKFESEKLPYKELVYKDNPKKQNKGDKGE